MAKYSIKELEQLSGIKAHTIRMWEKRHKIVEPKRTDTNIRYYNDEDLKKVLNVSILYNNGLKISKIADLSDQQLQEKVLEVSEVTSLNGAVVHIDQLVIAMLELDEIKFEKVLSNLFLRFGFEKTITDIIYPFLEKIGVLWLSGNINPAQEHFISNLVRQKIIVAIDSLAITTSPEAKKTVLYLPENEMHELGLLFYAYLSKKLEHQIIYLGQSVPFKDLLEVAKIHSPDHFVTSFTSRFVEEELQAYIKKLAEAFKQSTIYISGLQIRNANLRYPKNVIPFHSATELKSIFDGSKT
ncbi:MAG: MerR family transcriptional regulator [Bacteroidota bacterium]